MKHIFLVLVTLVLVGCTTTAPLPVQVSESSSYVAPAPAPVMEMSVPTSVLPRTITISSFIIAGAYLQANEKFSSLPVNIIFFPKKPVTKAATDQYVFICEMWKANFPKMTEVQMDLNHPVDVGIVPMYWMVKKTPLDESCESLVKHYDYTRAQVFAAQNKISPTKIQILCKLKTGIINMNISNIKKQEDLEMAMDVWRVKMLKPPAGDTAVYAYSLLHSAKEVLGAMGKLLAMN